MQARNNTADSLDKQVESFLLNEAEYLDGWNLTEWMEKCVDERIQYLIPLRETRMREDGEGFDYVMPLQDDDWPALRMRVKRLASKAAWSENPPTRIRHFISNIRVERPEEAGAELQVKVKSNILLYRSRGESAAHDLLSGERHDVLVQKKDADLRLLKREVRLDLTTVGTHNFAFIF